MSEVQYVSPLSLMPPNQYEIFASRLQESEASQEDLTAFCEKTLAELRLRYPNLKSLRRVMTTYRNVCRKVLGEEKLRQALGILNLTEEEIIFLNLNYVETVSREHRNLRPIERHQEMIRCAEQLLITGSPLDWVLGLCLLTGRRASEIGATACFGIIDESHVRFSGQLKTKTRESHPYVIPVLTNSQDITEALITLRETRPQWLNNPKRFKDANSSPLSQKVKKRFGEFILSPRVKDLRAAYAEIAYERFGTQGVSKTRFFSDILGHGENDIVTGQSYIDFYLAS